MGEADSVAAKMLSIVVALALVSLSGLHAAPMEKAIAPCKDCLVEPIADRVMGGEDPAAAEAGAEIDLLEDEDEAVGDRIMEDMNGMKDKFDVALKRIGDEISKDQLEQDEKTAGQ